MPNGFSRSRQGDYAVEDYLLVQQCSTWNTLPEKLNHEIFINVAILYLHGM